MSNRVAPKATAPNDFSFLVDANPRLNQTLIIGHAVCAVAARAGYTNPRLYCQPGNAGGASSVFFIPELPDPKPADWSDTSRDLASMGVPEDLAIYLAFVVDESLDAGNPPEEMNVAEAAARIFKADPVDGMDEFLHGMADSVGKPSQVPATTLALDLPGVKSAITSALKAFARPR